LSSFWLPIISCNPPGQAEGIALAKKREVYEGRKVIDDAEQREKIVLEANESNLFGKAPKKKEIMAKYKISRSTLLRYETEYRQRVKEKA
jgi:DNA invertase Pin-like site-specific DNA recombinase